MGAVHTVRDGVRRPADCGADEARLRRFAEDAWRELKEAGRRDVFLYGYLEQEAAALGLEDMRCS